jgi:two-component system copper resistance phosphate regulon response regulator CusR
MGTLLVHTPTKKSEPIVESLQTERLPLECVEDINALLELPKTRQFDAYILDLRYAKSLGLEAVRELRALDALAPIIVIHNGRSVSERIHVLEAGADDCLCEPFAPKELVVRLRVLLRRSAMAAHKIHVADLELDLIQRQATRQGKQIPLTAREFAVLECLVRNAGRPVSRTRIIEEVWNRDSQVLTNIVDVYVNYLRAKIDRGFDSKLIKTVYGQGYFLAA